MSLERRLTGKLKKLAFGKGLTKQAFRKECDINEIMRRAQRTGSISHLQRHGASYGDFEGFDFSEAMNKIAAGKTIFEELPSEVRKDFDQSPAKFFEFVNNPANEGKLAQLLPQIAEPGRYFPVVNTGAGASQPASEPQASETPSPAQPGEPATKEAPAPSEGV